MYVLRETVSLTLWELIINDYKEGNAGAECIENNADRGDDFSFATAYRLYGSRECGAPLKLWTIRQQEERPHDKRYQNLQNL